MTFLEHQERYRRRMMDFSDTEPMATMRRALEQNMEFWNRVATSTLGDPRARDRRPDNPPADPEDKKE